MDRITRKEMSLDMSLMDVTVLMAEGNPGALNVLTQLIKVDGAIWMMHLDDMNIRGTQIWIGYKDHCKQDLDQFIACIKARDPGMVKCINEEGMLGNHNFKAITQGASGNNREFLK